jgi:hypothetical protein
MAFGNRSSPSVPGQLARTPAGSGLVDAGHDYLYGLPDDLTAESGGADGVKASDLRIIDAARRTYQHEHDARLPHEVIWDRCWKRINNRYDWRRSAHWQSKKNLPAVLITHLRTVWERTKSLEQAGDKWLECETDEPDWQPLLDVPRDLVLSVMRSSGSDPHNNLLNVFYDAASYGSITGQIYIRVVAEEDGYIDMTPEQAEGSDENDYQAAGGDDPFSGLGETLPNFGFGSGNTGANSGGYTLDENSDTPPQLPGQKGFRIQYHALNSRHVLKDTAGRRTPRYIMHQQTMTKGEYRSEATARGWLHTEDVIRCGYSEGSSDSASAVQGIRAMAALEKDLARDPKYRDTVELLHYYGSLYDELGFEIVSKSYFCIANRRFLVCSPSALPYWHGQIPIVIGGEIMLPGAPYAKSLLEVNLDAQESRVETLNMLFDYLNQAINPPTEVDEDQLEGHPGQLNSGLYPGKVLKVRKTGNMGPAVARSGIPDMSSGVIQVIGLMKPELAEFTGMSDTPAQPRSRNRISASEFKERAAASGGIIEQIAKNTERCILEPLAWQSYLLALQKIPQGEWEAFIDRKISAQKNLTRTLPPGAGSPVPGGTQPAIPDPNSGGGEQRPAQPPNTGQQPSPRGKLPTGPGSVSPMPGQQNPSTEQPSPDAPPYEDMDFVAKLTDMRTWGPRQRFVELGAVFRFRVKIFTALESRREKLEQLSQLIQGAEAMPALASRIKWHVVAEEYVRALELDPEKFLWPNAGSTMDQQVAADQKSLAARPVSLTPPSAPSVPPANSY